MDSLKDKDNLGQYVRLKLIKLSSVAYLVSNPLSDKEPLKWALRSEWLDLLKLDIGTGVFSLLANKLDYLMSLMDIATLVPGASKMNFAVLKNECLSLRNVLTEEISNLDILPELPQAQTNIQAKPQLALSHNKPSSSANSGSKAKPGNHARQAVILDLIKQKGALSITDIANNIKDVSSKTVQRELADLVRNGIIKKEGEKRWSRYLLPA